jgi:hypothetical protein
MSVSLIDKIYECCFVPEYWPDVLDQLGHIANGPRAALRGKRRRSVFYRVT